MTFTEWHARWKASGELGPVVPGMTREALVGLFGEPSNSSATWRKGRGILVYGGIEFHFGPGLWLLYREPDLSLRLSHTGCSK